MPLPIEPDGGGTVGAVPFRITSQDPTVKVLAGGRVVDAMTIGVHGTIYGLDYAFTIPRNVWAGTEPQSFVYLLSANIQQVGGHDHVVGIQYGQDINAAGLLDDVLYVTVATEAVDQTALAVVPFATLGTPAAFKIIDDTFHQLQVVGALTGS